MSSTNKVNKVRIGVIGGGAIADLFHLPALVENERTRDGIQLVDTNLSRLKTLSQKYALAGTHDDYRHLAGKVDAVIVATPPASHFAICEWCLQAGIHVLCEKPLTEDSRQAELLVDLAQEKELQLCVNQTRRFFPTYQKIRELLEKGAIGEVQSISYHDGVEFDWPAASPHHFAHDARGAWSDTGVHLLDTICFWLGAKPTLVRSLNDSGGGPEAIASVYLAHQGCEIDIKVSRLGRLKNGFEIRGSQGVIAAEAEEWSEVIIRRPNGKRSRFKCGSRKQVYTDFARPMLENFLAACDGTEASRSSGADNLATIELLEQAYAESQLYPMVWNQAVQNQPLATSSKRVLITGASGFLGGRVAEVLHLTGAATPIAGIRNWSRAARPARFPIDIELCDIADDASVQHALSKADCVVHCAKTDDRDSIVGGTQRLLEAADHAGIGKFVFLSTAEVYGSDVAGEVLESRKLEPTGKVYGDAKLEAEDVCRQYASRLPVTILRPSLIYGPFSTSWSIDIAKRLLSGNWGVFEDAGEGIANLVYVDDLVQAIVLSLNSDGDSGSAYNINGPDQVTWNGYFERFNETLDLPALQSISPAKSKLRTWCMDKVDRFADVILDRFEDKLMEIYLRGGFLSKVMKRVKGELTSTPSSNELNDLFCRQAVYVDHKARTELGYQPQIDLQMGLSLTTEWLGLHELIPGGEKRLTCPLREEEKVAL